MSIYTCFIQHVINSMRPKIGKGAIVVPTGFLTAKSGVESNVLKKIIDDKIVYGVISMPSNVFANTGTNVSVLFFDNRRNHDDVILIDASKMGEEYKDSNGLKKKRLRDDEISLIVNTFLNREVVDDFSIIVDYTKLKQKYSLAAGQYFDVKIEYVPLTEEEFNQKMSEYKTELTKLFEEGRELDKQIMEGLSKLNYDD